MKKVIGFNFVSEENIRAAFNWMQEMGTCCMAYGDWTKEGYRLLTAGSIATRHTPLDPDFSAIDTEIADLLIMLPVLRSLNTTTLYWNDLKSTISAGYFEDATFGLDLTPIVEPVVFKELYELSLFVSDYILEHGEVFVRVVADITDDYNDDGQMPQSLEFRVTGAGDFQVLTDVSQALIDWGYSLLYVIE